MKEVKRKILAIVLVFSVVMLAASQLTVYAADRGGFVGWWQGEDNAEDIVGGNDGFLNGDTSSYTSGKVGLAFSFVSQGDYVWIPSSDVINELQELTIEAWARINSFDHEYQRFVYFGGEKACLRYVGEDYDTDGEFDNHLLHFYMNFGGNPSDELDDLQGVLLGDPFEENVWYHVVGTYDGSHMRLYRNGELVGTHEVTGNFILKTGSEFFGYPTPESIPLDDFDMNSLRGARRVLLEPYIPYFNHDEIEYDNKGAMNILNKNGFRWPKVDRKLLHTIFQFCLDTQFITPENRIIL